MTGYPDQLTSLTYHRARRLAKNDFGAITLSAGLGELMERLVWAPEWFMRYDRDIDGWPFINLPDRRQIVADWAGRINRFNKAVNRLDLAAVAINGHGIRLVAKAEKDGVSRNIPYRERSVNQPVENHRAAACTGEAGKAVIRSYAARGFKPNQIAALTGASYSRVRAALEVGA